MTNCPYCGGEINEGVTKCRHCGEWLDGRSRSPQAAQQVHVHHHNPDDPTFAIITLLLYLFVYPVGVILNVIGLFTGPKRGCFMWMLIVFVGIPLLAGLALLVLMMFGALAGAASNGQL